MRKLLSGALAAIVSLGIAAGAEAAEGGPELPKRDWSFAGIFGKFDRAELQRGFQVYQEVCAGCHSLDFIAFRNLADLGYNEDEIKAFAAEATVVDGPDDEGEMFEREGRPSDYFPAPFPNAKAAAAANNGATPPDLSLMAKARPSGPDYIYALMTGYAELPENWREDEAFHYLAEKYKDKEFSVLEGLSFNHYFPGHQIAMAAPLYEEAVEYGDGTEASVEQMAHDVTSFLMPKLEARKGMGIGVMLFLLVFTGVLYAAKRKIWAELH
jgi:ubiquinol-cytochrome c reductase cytochrome c1 subunit